LFSNAGERLTVPQFAGDGLTGSLEGLNLYSETIVSEIRGGIVDNKPLAGKLPKRSFRLRLFLDFGRFQTTLPDFILAHGTWRTPGGGKVDLAQG
jgi:hypothetical protein